MNRAVFARAGFTAHQRVTVQGEAGALQDVEIIPGEIRAGAALMFYPEVNAIFKAVIDSRSGTPAFKRVPVLVRSGRGAVADGVGVVPHRNTTHCIILDDSATLAIGWIGLPICPCEAMISARFKRCLSTAL